MANPGSAESCQVSLLVPHPRRTAVLVAADTTGSESPTPPRHPRLPTLQLPTAEPFLSEILVSADVVDPGTTVVLRQVMTSSGNAADGEVTLMVEFDAGTAEPPAGWTWQSLDEEVVARLDPEASRAAVAAWLRERATGWSPRRPPWSHPGWFRRAATWMVEQMAANGRPPVGAPQQHQLWNLSVVLRCRSHGGDVFFKCSADVFRREAAVTQALAQRMPNLLPEVLAIDSAQGWMLMDDLAAAELGDQEESLWHKGVVAHARIQQSWRGRADELVGLGLPSRPLTEPAVQVEQMADDTALRERAPRDLRERWLATVPSLVESCLRLDEIGPGPTLVHGDFHPWNVVHGAGATRVFDWTDAAVSHPFVDLATYVFRSRNVSVRQRVVDAYVSAWSTEGSEESLREAAALGLVVGALYQVRSYCLLLPTLMGSGADDDMAGADLDWMNRSLTRHQQGLESPG
jgi:hypothetical protein